ncbi:hypothetical protein [Pedobacter jeongneungensis]|uniref:hypothetical protein n=1 Tax=Pedobacter jeongneungensis TaxID=947309 RepID=UPI0004680DB5|nr:hypothetical protein [Pedobacter jeongneungensis]
MKKTKKEAFFNILTRAFRRLEIEFITINSKHIIVTSGFLNGVTIIPDKTYACVLKRQHDWDKVHISLDIEVNYSFEVFLFKLHKYHILSEANYVRILKKLASNG